MRMPQSIGMRLHELLVRSHGMNVPVRVGRPRPALCTSDMLAQVGGSDPDLMFMPMHKLSYLHMRV